MDYEKKYKEALELARDYYKANQKLGESEENEVLSDIFPELKESEDERIRKALLEMVHDTTGDELWIDYNVHKEEALAWLEKQGKQKETLCDKCKKAQPSHSCQDITALGRCYIENINTSTNKVKPKFKVGDWVVFTASTTLQIVKVDTNKRLYWFNDNSYLPIVDEECLYLWTIQDAKAGDVLCTYECGEPKIVFILKGAPKKHYALSYHCYYNIMYPHFASDSEKGCLAPNDEDVKPATKEQRDLLFQKMKESGYEWNAEKKELKKISQRTISAEAKEAMYDKLANEEMIETLRTEYEKGRADAIAEMQKDWSKEDEEIIKNIISVLDWDGAIGKKENPYQKEIDWLKSLKNRVQPKQEWSEEDAFRTSTLTDVVKSGGSIRVESRNEYVDWLKSLKERCTWKPSDEQMKALADALSLAKNCGEEIAFDLRTLHEQLKKLREE